LRKQILLLTGSPGIGKTTVLIKTVELLKAQGIKVGGMVSSEVREANERIGFKIIDLDNGKHGWLANVNQKNSPRVGKYCVNLENLDRIGGKAILQAIETSQVIAIDEIGTMELYSQRFKQAVQQALDGPKPVLAVLHAKAKDPLITMTKQREHSELFNVTSANRDQLPLKLSGLIMQ